MGADSHDPGRNAKGCLTNETAVLTKKKGSDCRRAQPALRRLRVAAAFLADRERASAGRRAAARPPSRPPLRDDTCVSGTPRPEPLLLPPPSSLFTVAQARRSASFFGT